MAENSKLAYPVEMVRSVWAESAADGLSMALATSATRALEALQRAKVEAPVPFPDATNATAADHYKAVAGWTALAVVNDSKVRSTAASKRLDGAAAHLQYIAEVHALLVDAPSPETRAALAEAVMLGALLGDYRWAMPGRKEGSTRRFTQQQLEDIRLYMDAGKAGVWAARQVLGSLEGTVEEKSVYDYAVALAKRL